MVTVLPITDAGKARRLYPNEIRLPRGSAGLEKDSLVFAHQVRSIFVGRLIANSLFGYLEDENLKQEIREALRVHLDLD